MTNIHFKDLSLSKGILRALDESGYKTPTPIQAQAIPYLIDGHDILGLAQTGTGKTAAFSLPILNRLARDGEKVKPKAPFVLILAPTRELAIQIGENVEKYSKYLGLSYTTIFGGVKAGKQIKRLANGVDILIATPGRLLDLMNQGALRLDAVKILVLDEADRMLDMGFIHDMRKIAAKVPPKRQSLLFSATMAPEVEKLAQQFLNQPKRVEVTPETITVDRIKQSVHFVTKNLKRDKLTELLGDKSLKKVIVFTRTKHGANRVVKHLDQHNLSSAAIHGNKSQSARQKSLKEFHDGKIRILVATDIAARGIDVSDVSHVINFDLPNEPESYVHRIGRTARAGNKGIALSFCDEGEGAFLRDIETLIKRKIDIIGDRPAYADAPKPKGASGGRGRSNGGGGNRNNSGGGNRRPQGQHNKAANNDGESKPSNNKRRRNRNRPNRNNVAKAA